MARVLSKEEWRKRRRRNRNFILLLIITLFVFIVVLSALFLKEIYHQRTGEEPSQKETLSTKLLNGKEIKVDYLTPNPYSRPQTALKKVKGIVIHYTANPGTTADNNRSYFEGLKTTGSTKASSHYIIGLEGEIVQCVPLNEISYASNQRNEDTIAIENCHPDQTGKFNDQTYESLVALTAALCVEFGLDTDDVIRHYDVTEKYCPLYYVENEPAWNQLKEDIAGAMKELKAGK